MSKKYEIIVVPETHWDREWYSTFQQFRTRLVKLADKLLNILETIPGYKYYVFDGQTIVIEDYLEIRPEKKEDLKKFIEEKRLLIGPWYILPDEFLVSGEATIRNLMIGHKIGEEFGGIMKVGYVPDPFGHISQMPQILQGFGIDSFIFTRGLGDEGEELKDNFLWESPDGTSVLAVHQIGGYGNAANLGIGMSFGTDVEQKVDLDMALDRIKSLKDAMIPYANTRYLLFNNGSDHLEPQPDLPEIIAYANGKLEDAELVHGTYVNYVEKVKAAKPEMKTYKGEMRAARYAPLLPNVLSARVYIKQANERIQALLEKWAEPFSAFAWTVGAPYPNAFLWHAWKFTIKNHPHDSICGCSIDQVHGEMMPRFDQAEQIGELLVGKGLEAISSQIDTSQLEKGEMALVVYNPLSWKRTDKVEADIPLIWGDTEDFKIIDEQGKEIPYQIIERLEPSIVSFEIDRKDIRTFGRRFAFPPGIIKISKRGNRAEIKVTRVEPKFLDPDAFAKAKEEAYKLVADEKITTFKLVFLREAPKLKIAFIAEGLPSCGYKTYMVKLVSAKENTASLKTGDNSMENEYFKVEINPNGALRVTDKTTGKVYPNFLLFEDVEDVGDEYNYSPAKNSKVITSFNSKAKISLVDSGPAKTTFKIEMKLMLPQAITKDRSQRSGRLVSCPITSWVTMYPQVARIDVRTEFDNKVKDHRLRVLFPTDIKTDYSYAEGHFDVVKRAIALPSGEMWRSEKPYGTYPQRTFVDINDGERGVTIANKGLLEYEVDSITDIADGATIALTLLRSVGWLSRDDLLTRKGNAGPSLATPEAQCLGSNVFEYSIIPHSGTWQSAKTYQAAHQFVAGVRASTTGRHEGVLPTESSFVTVKPENLVVSAIKKAEKSEALIVRFYNTTDKEVEGKIKIYKDVKRVDLVNMNEEDVAQLELASDNTVALEVRPFQIVTLKFTF